MPSARARAKPTRRGEQHLPQAGDQRHRPDGADQVQVELQPDDEQQQRDPQIRASSSISPPGCTHAQPDGPTRMPTAMKAMISGWRNRVKTAPSHGGDQQDGGDLQERLLDDPCASFVA